MRKIQKQSVNCFNETLKHSNIDLFSESLYITYDIIQNIITKDDKISNFFKDCQINFIKKYSKELTSKFQTLIFKNWEEIKIIPTNYQDLIEIISQYEIKDNYLKFENIFSIDKISLLF